jgi:hypothetical protein
MPLFEVVIYETIKHRFEVRAKDEREAEGFAYEGWQDAGDFTMEEGITDHYADQIDYEIQDGYTTFLEDDPEPKDEDDEA